MYTETELTRLIDPTFRGGFHGASGSPPKVTNFGEDDIAEISFVKFQSTIFFENGCNATRSRKADCCVARELPPLLEHRKQTQTWELDAAGTALTEVSCSL